MLKRKIVMFFIGITAASALYAGDSSFSLLSIKTPDFWPSNRRDRLADKLLRIQAQGCVANDSLSPRELVTLTQVERNKKGFLGANLVCFGDHSVTAHNPQAIVPAGTKVFRGMKVTRNKLSEIFAGGLDNPLSFKELHFFPGVQDMLATTDISYHIQQGSGSSALISTTLSFDVAKGFAGNGGYILEIVLPENKGINIEMLLNRHSYSHEEEVLVAFFLSSQTIAAAYEVRNGEAGEKIPNPFLIPMHLPPEDVAGS